MQVLQEWVIISILGFILDFGFILGCLLLLLLLFIIYLYIFRFDIFDIYLYIIPLLLLGVYGYESLNILEEGPVIGEL